MLAPLVPAVGMPAWGDAGEPGVDGDVLDGGVALGGVVDGGVVVDGVVEPGGVVVLGVVDDGGVVVVDGEAVLGLPIMPGAPGEPALPIVGFDRTNDGFALAAPPALGEVTHPVTVTS